MKRSSKITAKERTFRIPVEIDAEITLDETRHAGIIENLSEEGLCIRVTPPKTSRDLTAGKKFDLKFQLPSGETLNLYCRKIWSFKITPRSLIRRFGMKIIDPPVKYKQFITTLE
jgi:hypothetical protein